MKFSRHVIPAVILLGTGFFAGNLSAQTVFTGWTFNNDTGTPVTAPATSTGSGTAASLGFNNTYSANGTSTDSSDVFLTTAAADQGSSDPITPASNSIWRLRGGGGTNVNGWNSAAPIGTQGAQFLSSTLGMRNIQVQFDWYASTRGEQKLQVQYTTNGGSTYINAPASVYSAASYANVQAGVTFATPTMVLTNTASANTVTGAYLLTSAQGWTNLITLNLSGITAANNNPNFGIRLVSAATGADDTDTSGAALNNTSGNWRFDEVNFSGTAVPEPATYVLASLGLVGLTVISRRIA